MRSLGVACVLSLLAIGCAGPNPAFVRAMDATQRVVGKEYLAYLASDPALSDLEKATRARTILLWRATIDEALGARQEAPR